MVVTGTQTKSQGDQDLFHLLGTQTKTMLEKDVTLGLALEVVNIFFVPLGQNISQILKK